MTAKAQNKKRPRDANQLAKRVAAIAAGDNRYYDDCSTPVKDPTAVKLGTRGGPKGGKAQAANLTPDQRRFVAQNAANVHCWKKTRQGEE